MEDTRSLIPAVSLAGEGETVWFLQNRMTLKATRESTGGAFGLVESWIAPGSSPPLHVHRREDESFFVIEGVLRFRVGDEEAVLGPGGFVFAPRNIPHTFVVESETPAHVLTLLTPGGGERFFVDGGRPAEGPGLPPPGPPDIEKLKRVAPLYGDEIIGPPLTVRGAR